MTTLGLGRFARPGFFYLADRPLASMWYCVIRVSDSSLVYLGQDREKAHDAFTSGTHLAAATSWATAEIWAAIGAGFVKRGKEVPEQYRGNA